MSRAPALHRPALRDPLWVRVSLILLATLFLAFFVAVPLAAILAEASQKGLSAYLQAVRDPETLAAVRLTLITAAISVPVNTVFGLAAAWALGKYEFAGKSVLVSLIDLPFSISPVISGLLFVLLFGSQGIFGPWLSAHDVKIIFAVPGVVLATTFVTFPFVAREVLPVMESVGNAEEEAGLTLGASGFQVFTRITLPKIRWGVLHGVILCNARAMGEFGAVSVVSGHIRNVTNTLPLHIEILYNEYNFVGAFSVSSLLVLLALFTLLAKKLTERRQRRLA